MSESIHPTSLGPSSPSSDQAVVKAAVQLASVEIVIGSVIHSFHIPFGGHLLSLNQARVLVRETNQIKAKALGRIFALRHSIEVSIVTALMKSLSPAGAKLGPMVSISVQGLLFSLGLALGGIGLIGETLGTLLLALWGFVQPFLSLFFFYGTNLLQAFRAFYEKSNSFEHAGQWLLGSWLLTVAVKLCFALILPWFFRRPSGVPLEGLLKEWSRKLPWARPIQSFQASKEKQSVWRQVGRDLTQPMFLGSLVLMAIFFYWNESSVAATIWQLLRPLALAVLTFYLLRSPRVAAFVIRRSQHSRVLRRLVHLAKLSELELREQWANTAVTPLLKDAPRILLLGEPGVGKTTLASRWSQSLERTHICVDDLLWESNKGGEPRKDWQSKLELALQQESWIIEGQWRRIRESILLSSRVSLVIVLKTSWLRQALRLVGRDIRAILRPGVHNSELFFWIRQRRQGQAASWKSDLDKLRAQGASVIEAYSD